MSKAPVVGLGELVILHYTDVILNLEESKTVFVNVALQLAVLYSGGRTRGGGNSSECKEPLTPLDPPLVLHPVQLGKEFLCPYSSIIPAHMKEGCEKV